MVSARDSAMDPTPCANRTGMVIAGITTVVNVFVAAWVALGSEISHPPVQFESIAKEVREIAFLCAAMAAASILALVGIRRAWNRPLVVPLQFASALWTLFVCMMVLAILILRAE